MKIGSTQGPTGGYALQDPAEFSPRNQSDGTEAGHAWTNLVRRIAIPLAVSWFGDYPNMPFPQWLQHDLGRSSEDVQALVEEFSIEELGDHSVIPSIATNPERLGDLVPIKDSPLAQTVLETLAEAGVHGIEVPCIGTGGGFLLDVADPVVWIGTWQTGFGSPCQVWFEIRRDDRGTEHCVIFTNLLISTRVSSKFVNGDGWSDIVDPIIIGRWCQTLLYLGETPFPSSMVSFSRSMAMESLPTESRPHPLAWAEKFALTCAIRGAAPAGNDLLNFAAYPLVLKLGYQVPMLPEDQLSTALTFAFDALVSMATIVEDGFRNSRGQEHDAPFDDVFLTEYWYATDGSDQVGGYARWVPEPLLGSLVDRTRMNYDLSYEEVGGADERRAALQWVADNGAGTKTASAINSLAYSYLIPNKEFDAATFYLQQAVALQELDESTNAMANLGAMLIAAGDTKAAEEILLSALEQPDKFAEGEASVLLGRIYRDRGDNEAATTYFERAFGSQHPDFAEVARHELIGSPERPVGATSSPTTAKFCSNCGTAFTDGASKFCAECGTKRG
jgi:tetratricopeptide (TPR) repeat protein